MNGIQALLFLVAMAVVLGLLFVAAADGRSEAEPEGTPFDPPPRR